MYVSGTEPECCNLQVRNLNTVTYIYVSDTELECCIVHVCIRHSLNAVTYT
jgi:hypothetical protein